MGPMDMSRPYADLIPGARGCVLATLVQLEVPVTVRGLARHAGVSPQSALSIVNELSAAGVVLTERVGSALRVSLNRNHLAVEPLLGLFGLRGRLIDRLRTELGAWPDLSGAWLFGSTARAEGDRGSDVDLLLVARQALDDEAWTAATARLQAEVAAWTGNEAQLVEHTTASFARLVKQRNPLVEALRQDGVPLTAATRALLRGAA